MGGPTARADSWRFVQDGDSSFIRLSSMWCRGSSGSDPLRVTFSPRTVGPAPRSPCPARESPIFVAERSWARQMPARDRSLGKQFSRRQGDAARPPDARSREQLRTNCACRKGLTLVRTARPLNSARCDRTASPPVKILPTAQFVRSCSGCGRSGGRAASPCRRREPLP